MVASGELVIDRFDDGVPILIRGHGAHNAGDATANVTHAPARETHSIFELQSQPPQSQPLHMTFE
jgi:hypothetical protein